MIFGDPVVGPADPAHSTFHPKRRLHHITSEATYVQCSYVVYKGGWNTAVQYPLPHPLLLSSSPLLSSPPISRRSSTAHSTTTLQDDHTSRYAPFLGTSQLLTAVPSAQCASPTIAPNACLPDIWPSRQRDSAFALVSPKISLVHTLKLGH